MNPYPFSRKNDLLPLLHTQDLCAITGNLYTKLNFVDLEVTLNVHSILSALTRKQIMLNNFFCQINDFFDPISVFKTF